MISSNELTFVVQGPIYDKVNVKKVLNSIRRFFPYSRIILSTWVGSDPVGLSYDDIVYNIDPGAYYYYYKNQKLLNNNNRQIISSQAGLMRVHTKYAVKTRTDIVFTSSKLLRELSCMPEPGEDAIVYKRILAISNLSVNPNIYHKMLYHPSDFFFAGDSRDLLSLFTIPLMDNETMTWFDLHPMIDGATLPNLLPRFSNEQYIYINFLQKNDVKVFISEAFDFNSVALAHSEYTFAHNLYLCPTWRVGINSLKYPIGLFTRSIHTYTVVEWKRIIARHTGRYYWNFIDSERIWYNSIEALKNFMRTRFSAFFLYLKSRFS